MFGHDICFSFTMENPISLKKLRREGHIHDPFGRTKFLFFYIVMAVSELLKKSLMKKKMKM
jgi:hypothetical protein